MTKSRHVFLQEALIQALPHFVSVQWCTEIDSTNSELIRRANQCTENFCPALLGAERQTQGRGRAGRVFESGISQTLTFSCAYALHVHPRSLAALAPIAGIVACDVLRSFAPADCASDIRMKWPNDIYVGEHKLAGLLVEAVKPCFETIDTRDRVIVVGMGINLSGASALSEQFLRPIGDWQMMSQQAFDELGFLTRIACAWQSAFLHYASQGMEDFLALHQQMDMLAGRFVQVVLDGRVLHTGIACGLDEEARLLIQTSHAQRQAITIGEVSIKG